MGAISKPSKGYDFTYECFTYIDKEVQAQIEKHLVNDYANPMSSYQFASSNKYGIEKTRGFISRLLGCQRDEIYFVADIREGYCWAKYIQEQKDNQEKALDILRLSWDDVPRLEENILLVGDTRDIGGPCTGGFIYIPNSVGVEALVHGGNQERARRGGTHDSVTILGMGKALEVYEKRKEEIIQKRIQNFQSLKPLFESSSLEWDEREHYFFGISISDRVIFRLQENNYICDVEKDYLRLWIPWEVDENVCQAIKNIICLIEECYE